MPPAALHGRALSGMESPPVTAEAHSANGLPGFTTAGLPEVRPGPLESGHITIARGAPGRFSRPLPVDRGDEPLPLRPSRPSKRQVPLHPRADGALSPENSGPLPDCIDIQIEAPAVPQQDLMRQQAGEPGGAVQQRVEAAHQRQLQGKTNARLTVKGTGQYCAPDAQGENLSKQAIGRLNFSARAYHRVLEVARASSRYADLPRSKAMAVCLLSFIMLAFTVALPVTSYAPFVR